MSDTHFTELERRLANLLRFGTIAEVDHPNARVKVQSGNILTDWLPFFTTRAGATKSWSPPTVGEQVLILATGGELTTAAVLPAIYTQNAPSQSADEFCVVFPDGTRVKHHHASGHLSVENCQTAQIQAAQSITADTPSFTATGNVVIQGSLSVQGAISTQSAVSATGDVSGNTITGIISINRADSFIKGTHNNQNSWYVGSDSASNNDVQLHSWLHGTTFTLKNDRLWANKALYVNDHQVYHTGNLPRASLTGAGISQLSSETNSNDETKAATPKAVKTAYDKAVDAEKKALPLGAVIAFPKEITHPTGFLKCNGTTFNQQTYPDLYRALGNKNKLPDLGRSDVGQLAYFPTDTIPDGWLACDGETISQTAYPELYRYLGDKYGVHGRLPNAEDRFIRNAGAGLRVGQVQADEFKAHTHRIASHWHAKQGNDYLYGVNFRNEPDANIVFVDTQTDTQLHDNGWITPTTDSKYATGGAETRPKSIVFKLCIKAKNSFDDVQFWIKAFGEVQNVGAMDASRLGQDIQALRADKADRNHSHTAAQISDFAQSVAGQFSYQKIGDHEVWKFPDGTMHQVLRFHSATGFTSNWQLRHQLVFPVAFRQTPKCFASLASEQGTFTNGREDNREPETWHILAIGRWK